MTHAIDIAERYIASWNEADAERRRALIARIWAADGQYVDPLMQGSGRDGIDALIAGAQQHFPGHRFALAGTPDGHHDRMRFGWTLSAADGTPVASGTDFGVLAADGLLQSVTGFLDTAPG